MSEGFTFTCLGFAVFYFFLFVSIFIVLLCLSVFVCSCFDHSFLLGSRTNKERR